MALCNITGLVYLPSGEPARSRTFVFRRSDRRIGSEYLGVVLPDDINVRTSGAGEIDVDVLTGNYTVYSGDYEARVTVPEAETADFADIVADSAIPLQPPVWYSEALAARDEAVAAADSIEGLTAATGPAGSDASYNPDTGVLTVPRGDDGADGQSQTVLSFPFSDLAGYNAAVSANAGNPLVWVVRYA